MLTLANDVVVDGTDGHIWLNVPKAALMGSFPNPVTVVFMQTPKEPMGDVVDMTGELGRVDVTFDQVHNRDDHFEELGPDFKSIVVGSIKTLTFPSEIPKAQVISSMVIIDKFTQKPCNIVNLRNSISLENINKITLHFGAIVYFNDVIKKTFNNVMLATNSTIDMDTFIMEVTDPYFVGNRVKYSSLNDYNQLMQTYGDQWRKNMEKINSYPETLVKGPKSRVSFLQFTPTVAVTGNMVSTIPNFDVKCMIIPYCPGIAMVMIFNKIVAGTVTTNTMNLANNERIDFNLMLDLEGV